MAFELKLITREYYEQHTINWVLKFPKHITGHRGRGYNPST